MRMLSLDSLMDGRMQNSALMMRSDLRSVASSGMEAVVKKIGSNKVSTRMRKAPFRVTSTEPRSNAIAYNAGLAEWKVRACIPLTPECQMVGYQLIADQRDY